MKTLIKLTDVDIKKMFKNYYGRTPNVLELREITNEIKALITEDSLDTIIHNAGTDFVC